MPRETIEQYLERKRAKGTLGEKKVGKRRLTDGTLVEVITPYCPCPHCGHKGKASLYCDPDYENCRCCHEICS